MIMGRQPNGYAILSLTYNDSKTCDLTKSASTPSWLFRQWDVQCCMGEGVEEHCKLQLCLAITIPVICCNFIKMICMVWIIKRDSEPLVTLGDAIASFSDTPDQIVLNACLAGQNDLRNNYRQDQPLLRSWEVTSLTYQEGVSGLAPLPRIDGVSAMACGLRYYHACCRILIDEQMHPDAYRSLFPSWTWALER